MVNLFISRKFTLEKWRKGEFDVGRNDIKRVITVYEIMVGFMMRAHKMAHIMLRNIARDIAKLKCC